MLAALLLLAACGNEAQDPISQVIVELSADEAVAARIVRIDGRVSETDGTDSAAVHAQRFALGKLPPPSDAKSVSLPFSFGIAQQHAPAVLLELLGFDSWAADAQPLIEHKTIIRFVPAQTSSTSIVLRDGCLGQAGACASRDLTCSAEGAVHCVMVGEAMLKSTLPGHENFIDGKTAIDAGAFDSMVADARIAELTQDAELADSSPSAQGDGADSSELPPEPLPACPVADACPIPEYPCIPSDDSRGYACRGQYAAWPMPDVQPDAKYAPSYTVDAAVDTVLDEVTGLLWQRDLPAVYRGCTGRAGSQVGDSCTHAEAIHYCSQLTIAGQRFRLPTKIEQESLIYPLLRLGESNIDSDAFPNTPTAEFWTSSRVLNNGCSDCAYMTSTGGGIAGVAPRSEAKRARCVRSARNPNAPPGSRYTIHDASGSVRDNFTDLEWLRGPSTAAVDADGARKHCLDHGDGYRVPTHKELLTLANMSSTTSCVDPAFFLGGGSWALWSTTPAVVGDTLVYLPTVAMSYASGYALSDSSTSLHVRCVR